MLPAILHVMTPFMGTVTPDSNPWQNTNKTLVKKSGTLSTNLSAMICGKVYAILGEAHHLWARNECFSRIRAQSGKG